MAANVKVKPGTTEHPDEVKALLKAAGMSEGTELTPAQAKHAEQLLAEGTDLTGERLLSAVKNGAGLQTKRAKYPEAVQELHAEVLEVCKAAGMNKPLVPKQTAAVRKALGDKDPAEALGLSATALKKYATHGERPKDTEALREFVKHHKALKNDANLGPRKLAVVAYAMAKQSS